MPKIISIHSFRGGTGKSNTVANVAAILASSGRTVGVIDTDIQSPGIHVIFGVKGTQVKNSLNDYLWGNCTIEEAALNVAPNLSASLQNEIYLIPSSIKSGEITRVLRQGYDVEMLTKGIRQFIRSLNLDVLLIDTHPGLHEETLLSIALSNVVAIMMRPDEQDYEGTGVAIEVARELGVPRMVLVVNKVPPEFHPDIVKSTIEKTYGCEVAAVINHSDKMMILASKGVFVLHHQNDPITSVFNQLVDNLMT